MRPSSVAAVAYPNVARLEPSFKNSGSLAPCFARTSIGLTIPQEFFGI
jgi:hypothetical protein